MDGPRLAGARAAHSECECKVGNLYDETAYPSGGSITDSSLVFTVYFPIKRRAAPTYFETGFRGPMHLPDCLLVEWRGVSISHRMLGGPYARLSDLSHFHRGSDETLLTVWPVSRPSSRGRPGRAPSRGELPLPPPLSGRFKDGQSLGH